MISGQNNIVETGNNVELTADIVGDNNKVIIEDSTYKTSLKLYIRGNNNNIKISSPLQIKDLKVVIGSISSPANNTTLSIGKNLSTESNVTFFLYDTNNKLIIGDNCMFSNTITVRCGELPHLIFSLDDSSYIGFSEGVFIGDNVWIGENAYINKRVSIPNGNIVAACSVVTKRFSEENCIIGGNPAKVVKKNITWFRNKEFLEKDSPFYNSFNNFNSSNN